MYIWIANIVCCWLSDKLTRYSWSDLGDRSGERSSYGFGGRGRSRPRGRRWDFFSTFNYCFIGSTFGRVSVFFLFNYLFSISNKPVVSYLSWLLNLRNIIFGKTREFRKTYLEMSLMCLKRLRAKTIKILFSPDFCFFPDLNLEE